MRWSEYKNGDTQSFKIQLCGSNEKRENNILKLIGLPHIKKTEQSCL